MGRPKIPLGSGSIEASPIIRYKDAIKARVSTMYLRVPKGKGIHGSSYMQVCPNATSIAKNGATHACSWLFQVCMMCVM